MSISAWLAMVTAIDSSVLLDVLLDDPLHAPASLAALRRASTEGSLVISETTLVEIVPALTPEELPTFLADWKLTFVPSTQAVALLAGEMFRTHLARGGKRGRVVPDFLIGAHAQQLADRLLARDRGYQSLRKFVPSAPWPPIPCQPTPVRTVAVGAAG